MKKSDAFIFIFLHLLSSTQRSIQSQAGRVSPLYTLISSECGVKHGNCNLAGTNTRNCSSPISFEPHNECVLSAVFHESVNQFKVTLIDGLTIDGLTVDAASFQRITGGLDAVNFSTYISQVPKKAINMTFEYAPSSTNVIIEVLYYFSTIDTPVSYTLVTDFTTTTTLIDAPKSTTPGSTQTAPSLTMTIIVVAIVLGLLLLLVACAIFGLTFAVVYRNKGRSQQSPLRIHSAHMNPSNMYETSFSSIGEGFKKVGKGTMTLDRPKAPTDPEYATLSEWKEMAEKPVHNPFYDSSLSLDIKKGAAAIKVPQLEWSSSAWEPSSPLKEKSGILDKQQSDHHPVPTQRKTTLKSNSLQDIKRCTTRTAQGDILMANSVRTKNTSNATPPPLPHMPPPRNPPSNTSTLYEIPKSMQPSDAQHPPAQAPPTPSSPRPPLPSSNKKKINLKHSGYGSSSISNSVGAAGQNYIVVNNNTGMSLLAQHNQRATTTEMNNEIINSEYGKTGIMHLQQMN